MAGSIQDGDATRALAAAPLPHSREVAVDGAGRLSRAYYTWAASIDRNAMALSRLADGIKAVLDTLPDALGSTDGTLDGIPRPAAGIAVRGQGGVVSLPISDGYVLSLESIDVTEGGTLQRITIDAKGRVIEAAPAILADLDDVAPDAPKNGDALVWTGLSWAPGPPALTTRAKASEALFNGAFVHMWHDGIEPRVRLADAPDGFEAHGFVLADVADGDEAAIHLPGAINSGLGGMPAGEAQYLAADGFFADAPSTTGVRQRLGIAIGPASLAFDPSLVGPSTADDLPEGATNRYYTDARAAAAAPVQSVNGMTGHVVVASGSGGEILVADGVSPPVMLTDDAETDFLYEG